MGVYFGCYDALVAEHLLHLADAGTARYQMRGERVAERVRADGFVDAGILDRLAKDEKDHNACQFSAAIVEKECVGIPLLLLASVVEVHHYTLAGSRADRHESLFVALANDADVTLAEEQVAHSQRDEFRHAQPARV